MPTGRPLSPPMLSESERVQLSEWTRRPKTAQALVLRARSCCSAPRATAIPWLLAACSSLAHGRQVAAAFSPRRLDGLLDEPRPGTPRNLSDAEVERVLARTLESQPQAATHWSTRSLAQATGLSQSSISRIWRAFSLQPHRSGDLQAEPRSAVHRQGPRHRRTLPQPSRPRPGALRG